MLPELEGRPIRVRICRSLGPHLAATSIPGRVISLDREVLRSRGDFERILIHEIFHFVWVRLSNAIRRDWEQVLTAELARKAIGELGWSSEWRKAKLKRIDSRSRSSAWRRYACESFCDTAAWRYGGLIVHPEFTLAPRFKRLRQKWFEERMERCSLAV